MGMRYNFSSFIKAVDGLLTPPCRGAPIVVWVFIVLFCFFNKADPIWHGNLSDPDDYLYLVQAMDWLNGQSWFDLFQHRMDPSQGTFIHYSHLLSSFYAGSIFLLQPLLGNISAAIITAAVWPLIFLGVFFFSMRCLAEIMIAPAWGDFTACILVFSTATMSQFTMGAIHHHGIEIILATTAFYYIARMIEDPSFLIWAMAAGIAMALGLALGLEIIAVILLLSFCLGLWAVVEGGAAARSAFLYAASLFIGSFVFLLMTRPPQHLFDIIIPVYSFVYVLLTGAMTLCFASVWIADRKSSILLRCVVGAAFACGIAWIYLHYFPALKEGPYGDVDPSLTKLIFTSEPEAWPLIRHGASWQNQILPLAMPVTALVSNLFVFLHAPSRAKKWLWGMVLVVLAACTALASFYQCRFFDYVQPFAALPLIAMIRHDWERVPSPTRTLRISRVTRLAILLLIGPISLIVVGNYDDDSLDSSSSSMTTSNLEQKGCDMHHLASLLNDSQGYGAAPGLIINSLNEGPELLFRTKNSILAGPYHMNVRGNRDALNFFTASDADEAEAIARDRKASFVVICNEPSQLRAYKEVKINAAPTKETFIQQLVNNEVPSWLEPISSTDLGDLLVFKIKTKDKP